MVLHSTRWLALSYFTYFFSYGIFLPFWSVWLKGIGLTPETIGILLGAGLVARFLGSLLIAPRVSDPSLLIKAVRILALLTLVFAACFWVSHQFAWLMVVMVGFNLFFSPLVPLTDALANTWQKQITMDYGRVRPVGLDCLRDRLGAGGETGQPLRLPRDSGFAQYRDSLDAAWDAAAPVGDAARGESPSGERRLARLAEPGGTELAFSGVRLSASGGACGVLWLQRYLLAGGGLLCLCGRLPVVAGRGGRSHYFRPEQEAVPPLCARDLLLLSAVCGVARWGIMGWTTELPWLIVAQILHCGTFTVCHLAAMRYIAAREGGDVIRLQAVYSAVAMGGSIAVMTVFAGFLYQHLGHGVFWVMALVALPAMFVRPKVAART